MHRSPPEARRSIACTPGAVAVVAALGTYLALVAAGWGPLPEQQLLENSRVRVTQITHPPGVPRPRHTRQTDQVIVFLDDGAYERIDPEAGARTNRRRKAGEVIWHSRGEDAPQLTNVGSQPYRTLVIELR